MGKYKFKYPILALGAESKGVFSIAKGRNLFISKDFGNLADYYSFSGYEKRIRKDLKKFDVNPKTIACDMHPDYNSTALAEDLKLGDARLIKIQHHHAHIASCMLDNSLEGRVIGVAFDGTGYGLDGNIWGGEFLISSFRGFKRAAHLKYIPMPGGEKAVMEPWRMAAAYLRDAFNEGFLNLGIPFAKRIDKKDWRLLRYIIEENLNSPLTSSIGRLFDAIASMLMLIFKVSNEAEAAVRLEGLAEKAESEEKMYKKSIVKKKEGFIVDFKDMIKGIAKDINAGTDASIIAAKFHNTLAGTISDICVRLRRLTRINKIILTGGVFQNRLLTEKARRMLNELKFDVYIHHRFPTTDAGISIGQIIIADRK